MFPVRAFAPRYFAARYWPNVGAAAAAVVAPVVCDENVNPFNSLFKDRPDEWGTKNHFLGLIDDSAACN